MKKLSTKKYLCNNITPKKHFLIFDFQEKVFQMRSKGEGPWNTNSIIFNYFEPVKNVVAQTEAIV